MKLIANALENMENFAIFPIISMLLFLLFFILLIVWVVKYDKQKISVHSRLPLDES